MEFCLPLQIFVLVITVSARDPEAGKKTPEIIARWGYPVETFKAITRDGYRLTLHRIPHGKSDPHPEKKRPVVFLQHGLEMSSSCYVVNLPSKSLGFMLADAGYDVWLGNSRGVHYSCEHENLTRHQEKFWQFSWYHMYKHDLDALINKALEVSGQKSLYYVGHSQGTLTMFAKLASEPHFAPKIKKFFALAPVARIHHVKGLLAFASQLRLPTQLLVLWFGSNEFMPNSVFLQLATSVICQSPGIRLLCSNTLFLISGIETNQMNLTRLPVFTADFPGGTSTMNILHFLQMISSGVMSAYDYGSEALNRLHYGQPHPEEYDLRRISTDMYLYWSDKDWLATGSDIKEFLLPNLNPKAVRVNVELNDFHHADFLWGERAPSEIYRPIIRILNDHSRRHP